MDNPNNQRRQNEPPIHHTPAQRYPIQVQAPGGGASERFRSAPPNASPSGPRSLGGPAAYSPYYQEPTAAGFSTSTNMPATAMGYGSEYDTRPQTQGFGGYNSGMMMYNVPQPSTQTPVYDTQQFSQRQQATMQMMAPDVTSTYFSPEAGAAGGTATATASATSIQQHSAQGAGTSTGVYQQNQPVNYGGSNMPSASASTMQQASGATEGSIGQDQDYGVAGLQEKWVNYQRQLGSVFSDIQNVSLERAAETLLSVSTWLLSQVAELGLSQDDASLHGDRIKLWNDFNHAWLALGFRQKEMMSTGQHLTRSQWLMSEGTIKQLMSELIQLCDGIERHGLVDYQYGVWEDEIESIFEECLDLCDSAEETAGGSRGSH